MECPHDQVTLPCGCEINMYGFKAGKHQYGYSQCGRCKSKSNKELKEALRNLLKMLEEWDNAGDGRCGFSGFEAINRAEELLGLPLSEGV